MEEDERGNETVWYLCNNERKIGKERREVARNKDRKKDVVE